MTATNTIQGKGTFPRGVHPPEGKRLAADMPIEVLPTPKSVLISLLQHLGAPCKPAVEFKQEVQVGDVIGEAGGFVSAPVHSSVNGTVGRETVTTLPNGRHVKCIPVTAGENQLSGQAMFDDVLGGDWPGDLSGWAAEDITKAVSQAGIVGMGGAAFPTHVKFAKNDAKPIDTLLVNGCECEPYLTADYRVMLEAAQAVITGAILAGKATGASNIIIAVENNKPQAIENLRKAAHGTGISVVSLKTKYPMGGEKQTIRAALGRIVPTGGLPLDVGVVVINVETATAIARAVVKNKPVTHRVVSVSGAGIKNPKNLLVPIGVSYGELIDYCGGLTDNAARVIAGGPMMGFTLGNFDTPVTKGTSGITVLTDKDVKHAEETQCVRCGRCVDVCPLNLVPTRLAIAARFEDWDMARKYHLMACMECGCCAYSCPASIPLVQLMRVGKAKMPK